jgi:hypothetical protein
MIYRCCLCDPADKIREGRIPNGCGVPLCAEHRAQTYWRSRQPAPAIATALPMSIEHVAFARVMLAAANEAT